MDSGTQRNRLTASGILLGLGLGGFFDGIVLHQVLQWHHMVSDTAGNPTDTVAGLETNVLWDGFFHVATYIMVIAGLVLLGSVLRDRSKPIPWSSSAFIGLILVGWGIFNLVEGLVDHQILGVHHVNETVPEGQWIYWDIGFLIWGAAMIGIGYALQQGQWEVIEPAGRRARAGGGE